MIIAHACRTVHQSLIHNCGQLCNNDYCTIVHNRASMVNAQFCTPVQESLMHNCAQLCVDDSCTIVQNCSSIINAQLCTSILWNADADSFDIDGIAQLDLAEAITWNAPLKRHRTCISNVWIIPWTCVHHGLQAVNGASCAWARSPRDYSRLSPCALEHDPPLWWTSESGIVNCKCYVTPPVASATGGADAANPSCFWSKFQGTWQWNWEVGLQIRSCSRVPLVAFKPGRSRVRHVLNAVLSCQPPRSGTVEIRFLHVSSDASHVIASSR